MPRIVKLDDPVVVEMRKLSTSTTTTGWGRDDQMAEAMQQIETVAGVDYTVVKKKCADRIHEDPNVMLWFHGYMPKSTAGGTEKRTAICCNPDYPLAYYDPAAALVACECGAGPHRWSCVNWRVPDAPHCDALWPPLASTTRAAGDARGGSSHTTTVALLASRPANDDEAFVTPTGSDAEDDESTLDAEMVADGRDARANLRAERTESDLTDAQSEWPIARVLTVQYGFDAEVARRIVANEITLYQALEADGMEELDNDNDEDNDGEQKEDDDEEDDDEEDDDEEDDEDDDEDETGGITLSRKRTDPTSPLRPARVRRSLGGGVAAEDSRLSAEELDERRRDLASELAEKDAALAREKGASYFLATRRESDFKTGDAGLRRLVCRISALTTRRAVAHQRTNWNLQLKMFVLF